MSKRIWVCTVIASATLAGCGGENTSSKVAPPGSEPVAKTKMLESGANLLQNKAPLGELNAYLDGFHFYNGNMQAQMEAHHYCGHLNEDLIQCVIFDGNGDDAKLMGVEYIVTAKLFATLPPEEKHLWHSHVHEVRSGSLVAPGIPEVVERELMTKIAGTYGKTWHTWHTDQQNALPLGTPMLMMGFTADGQANQQMIDDRDRRLDVSSAELRKRRADIPYPPIDPEADAWSKGIVMQLRIEQRAEGTPH
ncbi:hypothetical protein GCM10011487_58960 [Steroidobacter agaridevorans]|uniref:Lipoprotein n=1 Tax=Steroidobacter agaridevorans TaxID=2695856 RepID=A0A829YN24_9GAMM|nr:OBAP family protein [Steroidobacter agaridevorans]GFE83896.1 hypothetical protein GCM10011487_58960 [Steroidobacter agaridevorans]GFE91347.1 hypothetical protein GCM10011488_63010 [Steroidobacter agaridevorans]